MIKLFLHHFPQVLALNCSQKFTDVNFIKIFFHGFDTHIYCERSPPVESINLSITPHTVVPPYPGFCFLRFQLKPPPCPRIRKQMILLLTFDVWSEKNSGLRLPHEAYIIHHFVSLPRHFIISHQIQEKG